jgi:Fe2+ or Zn2+ uptake regulation protein
MQNITIDKFNQELQNAGLKLTYPRKRIFQVFQKTKKPLSASELASKLIDIHFVTVYRNLDSLSEAGIITKLPHGFKFRYELSDKFLPHHHHATCQKCGASFKLNSTQIEYLVDEAALLAGIKPLSHHIEVMGLCNKCDN